MKKIILIVLISILINPGILLSQDPPYYKYGIQHGLPSNEIYEMLVSKDGHIWLGTESGFVKFNGTQFKHIKPESGEEMSITQLYEHPSTGIYGRTFDGRLFLVIRDSVFQLPVQNSLIEYKILNDKIYYITQNQLITTDLFGKNESITYTSDENLSYVINDSLLLSYTKLINIKSNNQYQLPKGSSQRYLKLQNEILVFGHQNTDVNVFNKDGYFEPYPLLHNQSFDICAKTNIKEINKEIFITSFCGTYLYFKKRKIFSNYVITDIITDREGNYWFSTLGDGLILVPFIEILEYKRNTSTLKNRPDKIIVDKKGDIYIMGVGHLYRIKNNTIILETLHTLPTKKECQSVIYDEPLNKIYFESGGFYEWDLNNPEKFPDLIGDINAKNIHKTPLGYLIRGWNFFGILSSSDIIKNEKNWIIQYLSENYQEFRSFKLYSFRNLPIENTRARFATYLKETDTYVLGYVDKLIELNEKYGAKEIKYNDTSIKITAIYPFKKHYLVGARNIGLLSIKTGDKPRLLIKSNFFGNKNISKIEIRNNHLWIMISDRLLSIDLKTNKINLLNSRIGIDDFEYRDFNFDDNHVWISTHNSILQIPENINTENKIPPLLTEINLSSNGSKITPFNKGSFNYKNNDLQIDFYGINFRNRGKYVFKSFLKGYDREEQTIPAFIGNIHYKLLPPGDYELKIYAENSDGYKSEAFYYSFKIRSPFWQEAWFYVLLVLTVAAASYLIGFFYVRSVRKRNHLEKRLLESRLTSLKAQMNPHFIFNALGSIQYLVLQGDIKNANAYLGKFSKLMRMVLDASDLKSITLSEEIVILNLYLELEKLRMGESFNYKITTGKEIRSEVVHVPPLLLQPYIENAVRHGLLHKQGEKLINISFIVNNGNNELICIINDNGIGREEAGKLKEKSHRSFSSKANLARLQLYHQRYPGYFNIHYKDFKGEQTGTEVVITLPLDFKG